MKIIQSKLAALIAVALVAAALAGIQTRAQNLIVNGSFEIPAYPGNGDIHETDPNFTLPGWYGYNLSTNLFVEYGVHLIDQFPPQVQTRYADGRQALCLGEGGRILQSFIGKAGWNYVLSFAQADASMAAATVSQVTVTLTPLFDRTQESDRTFSRTNDGPGYTIKTWHFIVPPPGGPVLLEFTDTTTNGLPEISPFLDAISIVPGSVPVVGFKHGVPGGTGTFGQLPRGPGVWGSNLVFFGAATGGQQGIYGINNWLGDPLTPVDPIKIADTNTPIPGGNGNFTTFTGMGGAPPDPCISGSNVVFGGMGANNQQGIYVFPGDPMFPSDPIRIADHNTAVPPGNLGNFGGFTPNSETPPDPCISGNRVAFYAYTDRGGGIYSATLDGAITTIADTTTPTPGNSEGDHFVGFYVFRADPSISGNSVAFCGYSGNGSNSITPGVYLSTDGMLLRVADKATAIPGSTDNFADFQTFDTYPGGPQVSSGNVLFWGKGSGGQQGLYVKTPVDPMIPSDPMRVVADTQTAIPGGSSNFTGFRAMSLSGDAVAFVGLGAGGQMGIYVSFPSDPIKVIDLNDTLDGKAITGLSLSRTGLNRDQNLLAFGATFSDGTQGLYTINVFTGLRITSIVKMGADLQLSFTSQVGHNYTVQSRADLTSSSWSNLLTQIPGNGGATQSTISNAFLAPKQFFRIKQESAQ